MARSPAIRYAGMWVQVQQRAEHRGIRTQGLSVYGADNSYLEVQGGTLLSGRLFSRAELASGAPVAVIETEVADRLFGTMEPRGNVIRIGDRAFTVIGVFARPENIFQPPGVADGAHRPVSRGQGRTSATTRPTPSSSRCSRSAACRSRWRRTRRSAHCAARAGSGPAIPNSFDILTQDQILATIDNLTSAFFLVMVALSSVALLVGGIGVMAIMMVSVTDRTREIGVRKALGATRGEILWQFLVEAATLTAFGGLLGIVVGMLGGEAAQGGTRRHQRATSLERRRGVHDIGRHRARLRDDPGESGEQDGSGGGVEV